MCLVMMISSLLLLLLLLLLLVIVLLHLSDSTCLATTSILINWLFFPELVQQSGHKPGKSGKPGILRDFSEHGKFREFCATLGKIVTNQSIFSLSFKYLCKTAVDWVNRIIMILDEGYYYIYFLL